jgi:uncharacterized membrane protein SpoIIM required for sporulation
MQDARKNLSDSAHLQSSKMIEQLDAYTAIYIFATFVLGIFIISIIKMILYTTVCKHSNEKIHNMMATSLLNTTIQFFETNNSGSIQTYYLNNKFLFILQFIGIFFQGES